MKYKNKINIIILILLISLLSQYCTRLPSESEKYSKLLNYERSELRRIDTNQLNPIAKDYVIRGSSFQAQLYNADAILEFIEALRFDSSAAILYMIAKNYKDIGRYEQAINYSLKALEKNPTFIPAMELMSDIYMLKYETSNAITVYKNIVALEPRYERKLHLARLWEIKDPREALKIYEELIDSGDEISILNRLAVLYSNFKNTEKYIETLKKINVLIPGDINNLQKINDYYLENRKWDESLSLLDEVDKSIPPPDLNRFYIAFAHSIYSDSSKNVNEIINKFIKKVDNRFYFDPLLLMYAGNLSLKTDNKSVAEKYFDNALKTADTRSDFSFHIAEYYLAQKNPGKAANIIEQNIANHKNDTKYYFLLSTALIEINKIDDAIMTLHRAIKIDSSSADCFSQLGFAYDKLGKFDSLSYFYEKALEINPLNAQINNNYAYSLSVNGINLEKALKMSKIAIETDSENISFIDTFSWIQYRLGNYKDALEFELKAIKKGANDAEVYEHLGDIYLKLNSAEEAKKAYLEGLNKQPNNNSLREKLNKL